MFKLRRISLFLFAVSFILFSGCAEEEELERETLEPSPLPVTAAVVRVDVLYEVITSTGRVSSRRTQSLTAQIDLTINSLPDSEHFSFISNFSNFSNGIRKSYWHNKS